MLKISKLKIASLMLLLLGLPMASFAAAGSDYMLKAHNDLNNQESLQRGAKYFVNYCLGCHSAKYVRYSRIGEDLDISEDELVNNLMFNATKPFETMQSSMQADDALSWFGATPPDLSLISRSRNPDWLFTYLKSFYADSKRPLGSNNKLLPGASMPNVLWELQGEQTPIYHDVEVASVNENGESITRKVKQFSHFASVTEGSLNTKEFDGVVRDIVNFLDYIGEPVKMKRQKMGVWVILYLLILFGFAYFLKKEIWKDVH
jgi:ubiquinol-cytochrome c reductase cytochrome c1 subunit